LVLLLFLLFTELIQLMLRIYLYCG